MFNPLYLLPLHFGAASCSGGTFFGLPTWYHYLSVSSQTIGSGGSAHQVCNVNFDVTSASSFFTQVGLIGLGILEMLLYVAGLVTVGYVIYGGIQYVTSQGEPEKTRHAQGTILNALIGMAIAIIAASVVAFIGDRIGST